MQQCAPFLLAVRVEAIEGPQLLDESFLLHRPFDRADERLGHGPQHPPLNGSAFRISVQPPLQLDLELAGDACGGRRIAREAAVCLLGDSQALCDGPALVQCPPSS